MKPRKRTDAEKTALKRKAVARSWRSLFRLKPGQRRVFQGNGTLICAIRAREPQAWCFSAADHNP